MNSGPGLTGVEKTMAEGVAREDAEKGGGVGRRLRC